MLKYLRRVLIPLAITLMLGAATTERLAAQSIFESCETDLKNFCSQVRPGYGHIVACLYAHEDRVSESCDVAIEDKADLLDGFFESVRYVMDRCADNIQKHCAGTRFGEGRIFTCLVENASSLTDECRALTPEMEQLLN